jgi:phosphoglycerate dehydrogenase-like enzyme
VVHKTPFRVGITADFASLAGDVLEPGLAEVLRPVSEIECEMMPDTAGVAVAEVLDRYDAVIALDCRFGAESFRGLKRLKVIARWGVGYDQIDVKACTGADVILAITSDSVGRTVAEGEIALIFALAKNLRTLDHNCRAGLWRENAPMGLNLAGKTLGSVGAGNIARELFRMACGLGFGKILAYDPRAPKETGNCDQVEFTDLDTVLAESDFLTINCRLDETTRGMIGVRELSLMKPSAHLINTARGAIVDESALVAALRDHRIAGAGIDVFATEPALVGQPIFDLENVILSPHSIARTQECIRETSISACRSVLAVFHGSQPAYVVNREVIDRPGMRKKLACFRPRG